MILSHVPYIATKRPWYFRLVGLLGHAALAFVGTMLLCFPILGIINSKNPLLDVPYSPLPLIVSAALGYVASRRFESGMAKWVWGIGLVWMTVAVVEIIQFHDPKLCNGCNTFEQVWYSYFSIQDKEGAEGLGKFFVTTPFLISIAYSFGAVLRSRKRPRALDS